MYLTIYWFHYCLKTDEKRMFRVEGENESIVRGMRNVIDKDNRYYVSEIKKMYSKL